MRKEDLGRKYRINCDITRNGEVVEGSVSPSLKLVRIELKECCNYSEYLLREQRYRRVGDLNRRRRGGGYRIRSRSDMFFQEDMKLYVGGEKKGKGWDKGEGWKI